MLALCTSYCVVMVVEVHGVRHGHSDNVHSSDDYCSPTLFGLACVQCIRYRINLAATIAGVKACVVDLRSSANGYSK